MVTTGVAAAAVVSTTVEVDVVTTVQVTVGGVTTVFENDVVATAAAIPVFVVLTVAVGVVDGVVQVLIPGVAGAAVTAIAGGEQGDSLAFVWLGEVTVDAATLVLSTVTGEVVVAAVTPGQTAHRAGDDGTEGATGAITVIGVGLILRNCRPETAWRVLAPGIFCCRAPSLFITNWANTPPGEGRAAANKNLQVKILIDSLFAFHEVLQL